MSIPLLDEYFIQQIKITTNFFVYPHIWGVFSKNQLVKIDKKLLTPLGPPHE